MRRGSLESDIGIGELARPVSMRTSALRYYEDAGLLHPARRVGGKRRYEPDAMYRLLMIRFCQQLGFSLADIRRLATTPDGAAGKQEWRELVDRKLAEVESAIEQAKAVKRLLEESRNCDCVSPESCRFLEAPVSG